MMACFVVLSEDHGLWDVLNATGFHIPTQHLCHQCLPAHPVPVLEQFLTFSSIHTPSSFQAPQAVSHSPISSSLHRCLSRTKKMPFSKEARMPFPWHEHLSGTVLIQSPSWTLLSGDQEFTQPSGFALVSFLWFPSRRLRVPASPWPLEQRMLQTPVAASLTSLVLLSVAAHVLHPLSRAAQGLFGPPEHPSGTLSRNLPVLQNLLSCLRQDFIGDLQDPAQRVGTELLSSAPCRAPSASGGAEPLPEESGGSLQHIQQPPLRASSKSFRLFPPLLQVLKWSSQPQA